MSKSGSTNSVFVDEKSRGATRLKIEILFAVVGLAACGTNRQALEKAKNSVYQTDFSVVYSESLAVLTKDYPQLVENPEKGVIKTAWHPLSISGLEQGADTRGLSTSQTPNLSSGNQPDGAGLNDGRQSTPAPPAPQLRDDEKTYFARFEVAIVGKKAPFRVRVHGEASSLGMGTTPMPLRGANRPTWLAARVDDLRIDIHKKLEKYAVHLVEQKKTQDLIDSGKVMHAHLGKEEGTLLNRSQQFALSRDASSLKSIMKNDFTWKKDMAGSADVGAAMFEADPTRFAELAKALSSTCRKEHDSKISCREAEKTAWFEKTDEGWKFSSFY